jgi:predicted phosphate transport protein (TIGR00153 family)
MGRQVVMVFRNRQKEIEGGIERYCGEVTTTMQLLGAAVETYICQPDREALRENLKTIHKAESRADDLRADIEVLMYSKAIFPESRKDIMELLEMLDKIPNAAEGCIRMILTQHIVIPEEYGPEVVKLVGISAHAVRHVLEATQILFSDYTAATVAVGKVDELESDGDRCEAAMIEELFSGDRDGFEKILLRDLILHIGKIADRSENVGDRIRIIVAKRRI